MSEITLYHGSTKIIERPEFGKGNIRNDYGLGFYCTREIELAKEWACNTMAGGYANIYTLDTAGLDVLDLGAPDFCILHWLAILVNNRVFFAGAPIVAESMEYLTAHFLPDIDGFDAIKGYRADDSYFAFAMDFLSNTISLSQLSRAMRLGSLGEQFVLKSEKAFETLCFIRGEHANAEIYFKKRRDRDNEARDQYVNRERKMLRQSDDIFMLDIIREEMKNGDARL